MNVRVLAANAIAASYTEIDHGQISQFAIYIQNIDLLGLIISCFYVANIDHSLDSGRGKALANHCAAT